MEDYSEMAIKSTRKNDFLLIKFPESTTKCAVCVKEVQLLHITFGLVKQSHENTGNRHR